MRNLLLGCLLSICTLSSFMIQAQDENPAFRLEIANNSIFPQYDLLPSTLPGLYRPIAERVYNYSLQISAFYRFNPRLDLGLGLGYTNLDVYSAYNCNTCFNPNPSKVLRKYNKFRAFEIPLELRINWFKEQRKIAPYLSFGVTPRLLYIYQNTIEGEEMRVKEDDFSLGFNAGLGSRFFLNEKWSANIGAHFMASRYFELAGGTGIVPIQNPLVWLNEWYVKVGISRAF